MQTRNWLLNCVGGEGLKEQIYKTTLKFQKGGTFKPRNPSWQNLCGYFLESYISKPERLKTVIFSSNNDFTTPVPLILGGFGFSNFSSIAAVALASSFVSSFRCGLCKSTYSMYPTKSSMFA